jgi:hypothetical protein
MDMPVMWTGAPVAGKPKPSPACVMVADQRMAALSPSTRMSSMVTLMSEKVLWKSRHEFVDG